MNTVPIKISAVRRAMSATWVLCPEKSADLIITGVPEGVEAATVLRHANETAIALRVTKQPRAHELSYDRLGRGLLVNIGY